MQCAERLVVKEVLQADTGPQLARLLEPPQWISSHVVTAGAHSIRYDYQSEIRFGPALYAATVVGPRDTSLSKEVGKYPVFAPKSPYQAALGWYAFVEWRGELGGRGSSAIKVLDLSGGKIVATHVAGFVGFVGWRGGTSSECIFQEYEGNRSSRWLAFDAQRGKTRLLFRGGYEGHISADGRYLIVLRTRAEVFVALISIDFASVLDLKEATDFQSYVQNVTGVDTVSFDSQTARLTTMLNWAGTDYQTNQIRFEKLITIEVSHEAEPGN